MAYQAFRSHGFPTFYDENKTAWQADILESGLIFAFCIVAASFFIILPGIRGKEVSLVTGLGSFTGLSLKFSWVDYRSLIILILAFGTIICRKCRARSACTYVQADLTLYSPLLYHLFLSLKSPSKTISKLTHSHTMTPFDAPRKQTF